MKASMIRAAASSLPAFVLAVAALLVSLTALGANQGPVVSVTEPASGAKFYAPANISIGATASDPDGTVAKVEFFAGTSLLGSATSAPYAMTWASPPVGSHSLTAKATDNLGKVTFSSAVVVQVVAVTTTILEPAAGAVVQGRIAGVSGTFVGPDTTSVIVTAGGGHSAVATVAGSSFSGSVLLSPGANTIEVQVARRDGTAEIARVAVTAVDPPVVAMAMPASCMAYTVGQDVSFVADAASAQGTVTRVEFFDNGVSFGVATAPPYSASRTLSSAGQHFITARATDSFGFQSESAPFSFVATSDPPVVSMTSPTSGAAFRVGGIIDLTASASDPDGVVSRVDYFSNGNFVGGATVSPFAVAWSGFSAGSHSLTARATDNSGLTTTSAPVLVSVAANAPPTVSLAAPLEGASFTTPANVAITANAADPDGSVARVDFLANGGVIGQATSAPYSFTWPNVPAGNHSLAARAFDQEGASTLSAAVNIVVNAPPPNQLPTVSLTSPAAGSSFTVPTTITLSATAADADGFVAFVEFFDGAEKLATVSSSPYAFAWANPALGAHTVIAKATDDKGAQSVASVEISVNGTLVSISQPASGASFDAPATYDIVANVSTSSGNITQVEFLDGQAVIGTGTVNMPSATLPFRYSNVAAGTHVHSVRATHSSGEVFVSPSTLVQVRTPPSVSLVSPVPGEMFIAPGTVVLTAEPSGFPQSVTAVQFFMDGQSMGQVAGPPYEVVLNNVPAGAHALYARAVDEAGSQAISGTIGINVGNAPAIQLAGGIDGSAITDDRLSLSGTLNAPANTSVIVAGQGAVIDANGNWFADAIPLSAGVNSLTITVRTPGAADVSRTISVTSTGSEPFDFAISPAEGVSPLVVSASLFQRGQAEVGRVEFDADSDGSADATVTSLVDGAARAAFSYGGEGAYRMTVRVFSPSGAIIYSASRGIFVGSGGLYSRRAGSAIHGMLGRLLSSDSSAALQYISGEAREKYQAIFTDLGAAVSSAAARFGKIEMRGVSDSMAEFAVTRETPQGVFSYPIYLLKGSDGIWRIEGM